MNWIQKQAARMTGIKFPKIFGNVFASLLGSIDIYDDNLATYLIEGYRKNDIVYSAVTKTANGVAKAKWKLKDKKTGKEVKHQGFEELKRKAAPQKTLAEVFKDGCIQNMVTGNAYYVGEYGNGVNSGFWNNVYIVPSENMQIRGSHRGIQSYFPNIATGFSSQKGEIPAKHVLHIKMPNPVFNSNETTDWLYGQSPLRPVRISIQTYNESKEAGLFFTHNKGASKALLLDENVKLGPTGEDKLKGKVRATSQGIKNTGNLPILEGIKGVIDIGADPKAALVLEQRAQAAQEICNVYNFPSALVGVKDATYQNAKEAKKAFWEDCVIPQLEEIRDGFNRWIGNMYGEGVELDFDISHIDALKEDRPVQDLANIATNNEARIRAGLELTTEAWGNERYVGFTQSVIDTGNGKAKKGDGSSSKSRVVKEAKQSSEQSNNQ